MTMEFKEGRPATIPRDHDIPGLVGAGQSGGIPHDGSPLTIGYFSPGWPPESFANGVVSYVSIIAAEMRRLGHWPLILPLKQVGAVGDPDVYMTGLDLNRPAWALHALDKIMYRILPFGWHSRKICGTLAATVRRLVRERGLQLIEMEESFGWPALIRQMVPIPVIVRLHGPWFLNGPLSDHQMSGAAFRKRIRREGSGIRSASWISAPSHDVLERTRAFYGLPLEESEVIPNPAPTIPAEERWCREQSDPDSILFVGRFDRHKGGDLIIDAFARIARENPKARLSIAGEDTGLIDSRGRRKRISDYILEKLPDDSRSRQVEWVGHQSHTQLAALRRRAGVTVCCSRYEVFGYTVIEAMSYGSPLVATRTGGVLELVEDGVNGLLCQTGDVGDLAEKILHLQGDGDLAARLGRQAALDCESRFNVTTIAEKMASSYRRIIAQSASSGFAS